MTIKGSVLYLDTAHDDCLAADNLYNTKLYSQSLLFLYQAVEKICKYYAIRNVLINPNEVKNKIGHSSLRLFTKLLKEHFLSLENFWLKSDDKTFDLGPYFKEVLGELTSLGKIKSIDVLNVDNSEIDLFVFRLDLIDRLDKLPSSIDYLFHNSDNLINGLVSLGIIQKSDIENLEKERCENLKFNLEKSLKLLPIYQKTVLKLIFLTTIFNKNQNETRYPDLDKMKTPSQIYDINHPIVPYIPKIIKHISSIIETFKTFNEMKI